MSILRHQYSSIYDFTKLLSSHEVFTELTIWISCFLCARYMTFTTHIHSDLTFIMISTNWKQSLHKCLHLKRKPWISDMLLQSTGIWCTISLQDTFQCSRFYNSYGRPSSLWWAGRRSPTLYSKFRFHCLWKHARLPHTDQWGKGVYENNLRLLRK